MSPSSRFAAQRGTTLIEAMIAMSVVLVGLLGFMSTQTFIARSNTYAQKMRQAGAIASDFEENVARWRYDDARLASTTTVASVTDSVIASKWDMGREATATFTAQYSDTTPDANASNPGALGTTFQGISTDLDADGKADFTRYWNVVDVDLAGTGTPNGKLVQIIVRWHEGGYGYRQVTATAFKSNPAGMMQ